MFIPGQVRMNKVLSFIGNWKGKTSTEVAESKTTEAAAPGNPIKEVTYSAPAAKPAVGAPPAVNAAKPAVKKKTTTY